MFIPPQGGLQMSWNLRKWTQLEKWGRHTQVSIPTSNFHVFSFCLLQGSPLRASRSLMIFQQTDACVYWKIMKELEILRSDPGKKTKNMKIQSWSRKRRISTPFFALNPFSKVSAHLETSLWRYVFFMFLLENHYQKVWEGDRGGGTANFFGN